MKGQEIPKAYEPKDVERRWYAFWEESGFFKADARSSMAEALRPACCRTAVATIDRSP